MGKVRYTVVRKGTSLVLADYLIRTALETKHGNVELAPLDDTLEQSAHDYMVKRLLSQKQN